MAKNGKKGFIIDSLESDSTKPLPEFEFESKFHPEKESNLGGASIYDVRPDGGGGMGVSPKEDVVREVA